MDHQLALQDDTVLVTSIAVKDIVGRWTGRLPDSWKLSLIQRDLVWDEYRMARLLDSLLKGYPVGTILLCKTTKESTKVLEPAGDCRRAIVDDRSWQLLDGQQRTFAMANIFSSRRSDQCRFLLHMSAPRPDLKVSGKDLHIRDYIRWEFVREPPESQRTQSEWDRGLWLDLASFGDALWEKPSLCDDIKRILSQPEADTEDLRKWLRSIDGKFERHLEGKEVEFKERLQSLMLVWSDSRIPIHRIKLKSADEVLQVFTRVNLEGVRTSAADIFFAGVKTLWNDAEERLDMAAGNSSKVLDRLTALRLVARVASYDHKEQDIIPLDLSRLKGTEGADIVKHMESIVSSDERQSRIKRLGAFLVHESGLGHALHYTDGHLLDHVFCWAMENPDLDRFDLKDVATYLFAGTAFRLFPVFGDTFSRLAFDHCFKQGRQRIGFPLNDIIKDVKEKWPNLNYFRSAIPSSTSKEQQREIVRERPYLFLSLVQGLPYNLPEGKRMDWDHLYAQSLVYRMKWKGQFNTEHSHHHEYYGLVWKAGNLCALDATLNRSWNDDKPTVKLAKLKEKQQSNELWPKEVFVSDQEESFLLNADNLIEEKQIDKGMNLFRQYVESREDRMWCQAVERFPKIKAFQEVLSIPRTEDQPHGVPPTA